MDRTLRPDGPLTNDLLAILNTGYRVGGVRVVSVPTANSGWEAHEMRTFAPVAMAGNAPRLPDDTVQRSIRVLLMPDLHGTVQDSDWEEIEDEAKALQQAIAAWADSVRSLVKGMTVTMPDGCVGRFKRSGDRSNASQSRRVAIGRRLPTDSSKRASTRTPLSEKQV